MVNAVHTVVPSLWVEAPEPVLSPRPHPVSTVDVGWRIDS